MADMQTSVEFIEYTLTDTTGSVNLSKGQDYTNCVPFMTLYGGQDYQDCHCVDVYFSGTTESGVINFERSTSRSENMYIKCYVVEFDPDEVKVHQGSLPDNVSNTTSENEVTVSGGFVQTNSFMVFNWKSSSGTQDWNTHLVRGRVSVDGDLVDFYRNDESGTVTGHWFLVESINNHFTVEHKTGSFGGSSGIEEFDFRFDFRRVFFFSFATDLNAAYTDRSLARCYPSANGYFYMDKYDNNNNTYYAAQVLTFLAEDKVFSFNDYPYSLNSSQSYNFDPVGKPLHEDSLDFLWNPDDMCVFTAAPQGLGCVDATSSSVINQVWAAVWTSTSGVLDFGKDSSGYDTRISVTNIVDWNGFAVSSGINNDPFDPDETFVKSVENNTIELETWSNIKPLTKGQDINNCVVFTSLRGTGASHALSTYTAEIFLAEPGLVVARRGNTADRLVIEYSVVEFYPDQVRVRKGYGKMRDTSLDATVSGIDLDKSFLVSSWLYYGNDSVWRNFLIKASLIDSSTIRHARTSSGNHLSFSWALVEDIAGNNFEVEHLHSTAFTNTYTHFSDTNYPFFRTFLVGSYSGGSSSYYTDRSCLRMYPQENYSFVSESYYNAENKYDVIQAVKIIRSNRLYTTAAYPTFSTSGETSNTYNISEHILNDPDAISVFSTNLASVGESDTSSSSAVPVAFASASLDIGTGEYTIAIGNIVGNNKRFVFNFVNWKGYSPETEGTKVDTRSVIESIETFNSDSVNTRLNHYLTKGQNVSQCVPFASWKGRDDSGWLERLLLNMSFYDGDNPYLYRRVTSEPSNFEHNIFVVEFGEEQVNVQQGTTYMTGSTLSVNIDSVDLDRAFLVFYYNPQIWNGYYRNYLLCGYWGDNNTINFYRENSSGVLYISYYVVECKADQWKVQHLHEDINSYYTNVYLNSDPRFELNRSLFLTSYSTAANNAYSDRTFYRTILRPDQTIQFSKTYASEYIRHTAAEIIEFNNSGKYGTFRSFFDYCTIDDTVTSNTVDFTLGPSLDLSRAMVITPPLQNIHSTDGIQNDADQGFAMYSFTDNHTVTGEKEIVRENTYGFPQVIEFPEYKAYYVEGNVVEQDLFPVVRTVRMYRSDDGSIVDEAVSASGTGYFRLETSYSGAHYVVCLDDDGLPDYNDLIYGRIYPELIEGCFADNEGLV